MAFFRFRHVCIESYALELPTQQVTSAEIEDRLAPVYQRLEIPFGTLEKLSGVHARYMWDTLNYAPSLGATAAAKKALEQSGFPIEKIGALVSCSVTRDYFEPATASLVARRIELPETAISMDIGNACIGFSNGLLFVANLIESGVIKAGLVVTGESIGCILENTAQRLLNDEAVTRQELVRLLPSFTLGCGAAACLLVHESIATQKHRLTASAVRSASQFNDLCVGDRDYCILQEQGLNPLMFTDSGRLIPTAAELGARTWRDLSEATGLGADDITHIFCHQVGKQVNTAFYQTMGLDIQKEFTVYQQFGNLVSASLPAAFFTGIEQKPVKSGERALLTAFGSGLNAIFSIVEW